MASWLENRARALLASADIRINGSRAWDIAMHDPRWYGRVARHGSLGLGESYMEGWWDCEQLDEFFTRVFAAEEEPQHTARPR